MSLKRVNELGSGGSWIRPVRNLALGYSRLDSMDQISHCRARMLYDGRNDVSSTLSTWFFCVWHSLTVQYRGLSESGIKVSIPFVVCLLTLLRLARTSTMCARKQSSTQHRDNIDQWMRMPKQQQLFDEGRSAEVEGTCACVMVS